MFGHETCPRCAQEIALSRLHASPKVCDSCGYVLNNTEKIQLKRVERNSLISVVIAALFILAGFVHLINWGNHSLEIVPLQAASLVGIESPARLLRLADICLDVKKFDCVETAYFRLAATDNEGWIRLGKIQFNRGKYVEAAESFRQYFSKGGQDLDAAYSYARALGEAGRSTEASKYFDYVLAAKPGTLQITVAQAYVKMLVSSGHPDQALKVIDSIRRKGQNAAQFMDSEYKVIQFKLGTRS